MRNDSPARIAALARAGKQAQAVAAATEALTSPRLGTAQRVALLNLRAESLIAEGRFADAAHDATEMLAAADAQAQPALTQKLALRLLQQMGYRAGVASNGGEAAECLAAGMDDYVTKPIRVDALVEALNQSKARDAS